VTVQPNIVMDYVRPINSMAKRQVDDVFQIGDLLEDAIVKLGPDYKKLFLKGRLRFDESAARKYRIIAKKDFLRAHMHTLPPCYTTLYELAKIEDATKFAKAVKKGAVTPSMSFEDAKGVRYEANQTNPSNHAAGMGSQKFPTIKKKKVFPTSTGVWEHDAGDAAMWRGVLPINEVTGVRKDRKNSMQSYYGGKVSKMDPMDVQWLLLRWAEDAERVLDCFAGYITRGFVTGALDYNYVGVDCWKELVQDNRKIVTKWKGADKKLRYVVSDARTLKGVTGKFDFAFVSPPYYDLESYSENPTCLAKCQSYQQFITDLGKCAKALLAKMNQGCFVAAILGDTPNAKGELLDLIGDARREFSAAGFTYHDRITFLKPAGTAALRAGQSWRGKKIVQRAEVALIFKVPGERKPQTKRARKGNVILR